MAKTLLFWLVLVRCLSASLLFVSSTSASTGGRESSRRYRLPGRPYETAWDDDEDFERRGTGGTASTRGKNRRQNEAVVSSGREFSIFDSMGQKNVIAGPVGGAAGSAVHTNERDVTDKPIRDDSSSSSDNDDDDYYYYRRTRYRNTGVRSSRDASGRTGSFRLPSTPPPSAPAAATASFGRYPYSLGRTASPSSKGQRWQTPKMFRGAQNWWTQNVSPCLKDLPKIAIRIEPTTTLKLRKTFRPLKTIIRIGADYNTQIGVWQFKSSWEDAIIGSKLTLAGKELQLTKSWQISVGSMQELVTRLRFRAAVDLTNFKAYARIGFRTERLPPLNVMEGVTVMRRLPLDGGKGHVKLEVKANFALPEPEIEYSTESQRSVVGMGDIEIGIDELNLVLDY